MTDSPIPSPDDRQEELRREAEKRGLLGGKIIKIGLSQANNEPLLTLTYVGQFVDSLVGVIDSGNKQVYNPAPSVLRIVAGDRALSDNKLNFDPAGIKTQDLDRADVIEYLAKTIYPEDAISLLGEFRLWIATQFREHSTHSWPVSIQALQAGFREARDTKSRETVFTFSRTALKRELEDLSRFIAEITSENQAPELDSIDDLLTQISTNLGAQSSSIILGVWQDLLQKTFTALRSAGVGSNSLIIPNKQVSIPDARRLINHFYQQLDSHLNDDQEPWTNLSQVDKEQFAANSSSLTFGAGTALETGVVVGADLNLASNGLSFYEQFFQQLLNKPVEEEVEAVEKEEAEEDAGGEEEEQTQIPGQRLTLDQITSYTLSTLPNFLSFRIRQAYNLTQLDERQLGWLSSQISLLINDELRPAQLAAAARAFFADNAADNETDVFIVTDGDLEGFYREFAQVFFNVNSELITEIVGRLPSPMIQREAEEEKPDQAVVPPTRTDAAPSAVEEPTTEWWTPERKASYATAKIVGLYFEGVDVPDQIWEELNKLTYSFVKDRLPADFKTNDNRAIYDLYQRLLSDGGYLNTLESFSSRQLGAINLADSISTQRIFHAVDGLLLLVDRPGEFVAQLSDQELIKYFGLGDRNLSSDQVKQLRYVIASIVGYRRANYRIYSGGNILKSVFKGKDGREELSRQPSRVLDARNFVALKGTEGMMALNVDEGELAASSITDRRKKTVANLRREAWQHLMGEEISYERLVVVYAAWGVDYNEIARKRQVADFVPPDFNFNELAAQIELAKAGEMGLLDPRFAFLGQDASWRDQLDDASSKLIGKLVLDTATGGAAEAAQVLKVFGIDVEKIVGEQIKEQAKKLEKIAKAAAAAMVVLVAALMKLLRAAFWTVIGATAGTLTIGSLLTPVLGPFGYMAGAGAGAFLGNQIQNGFAGLKDFLGGIKSGPVPGTGVAQGVGVLRGVSTAALATGGLAVGTYVDTTHKINTSSGAMLSPIPIYVESSIFRQLNLHKTASPNEAGQEPQSITYTITIAADKGFDITINDITDQTKVVLKDENKTAPEIKDRVLEDFTAELNSATIPAGSKLTFSYEVDYDESFDDAVVLNTFKLDFSYSNGEEAGSDTATTASTVRFGDYPDIGGECWPVSGLVTQIPFNSYSHIGLYGGGADAVDIDVATGTPVKATLAGTVSQSGWNDWDSGFGYTVTISGAGGTFIYAHLSSIQVSAGQTVEVGQVIGLSGNTGKSTNPHLHYERARDGGGWYSYPNPRNLTNKDSLLLQFHSQIDLVAYESSVVGCD